MMMRIAQIAWDCLLDLGVMVAYAAMAGLLIAAVSVSDRGLHALLPALGTAALLPLAVLVMIVADAAMRAIAERRASRRADGLMRAFRDAADPLVR